MNSGSEETWTAYGDYIDPYDGVEFMKKYLWPQLHINPRQPWFDEGIRTAKKERRRLERKWRKSGLSYDFSRFKSQKNHVNGMIENAKVCYYSGLVNEADGDQKNLFKIVKGLIKKPSVTQYPESESVA